MEKFDLIDGWDKPKKKKEKKKESKIFRSKLLASPKWQGQDGSRLHTHCLRCGRRLKDLTAMERGYGETCYKKIINENSKSRKLFN